MATLLVTFTFWVIYGFMFTFIIIKSVLVRDCGIDTDLSVDGTKTG